jgi:hypothetical protein
MKPARQTIYANVANFRLTPNEFVLEFGAHFPDTPGQPPPSDFQPDVRIVLPAGALRGILQTLQAIVQQQTQRQASAKQAPGFTGPQEPK